MKSLFFWGNLFLLSDSFPGTHAHSCFQCALLTLPTLKGKDKVDKVDTANIVIMRPLTLV